MSFPDHACFRYSGTYGGHSGRILLASWALFILILSSAFSAFLVTNFTTYDKPPIVTVKNLVDNKDYKVGMMGTSIIMNSLSQTGTDADLMNLWRKMQALNTTDPSTLLTDIDVHLKKVNHGGYVFFSGVCIPYGLCDEFIENNDDDLQIFPLDRPPIAALDSFTAVPKDAFYKQELYLTLLAIKENGILDIISNISSKAD